jgi:hypothetical protein
LRQRADHAPAPTENKIARPRPQQQGKRW